MPPGPAGRRTERLCGPAVGPGSRNPSHRRTHGRLYAGAGAGRHPAWGHGDGGGHLHRHHDAQPAAALCPRGNRLPEGHLLSGPVGLWFRAGRRWGRLSLVRQPMRSRRLCGQSAAARSDVAAISYPPGGGASAWRFGPAGAGLVERQPLLPGQ